LIGPPVHIHVSIGLAGDPVVLLGRLPSQLIEPTIMMGSMKNDTSEGKAHAKRARAVIQQLRDEMNAWLGWGGMSEPQAIGEYLVELTDMDTPLDSWLVEARKAYEEWKTKHPVQ
jgi:hypothetical protein